MNVLITGGTGSLGKALLDFYDDIQDAAVTVFSRDEVKQSELRREYPEVRFMLGDVRDYDRLMLAMRRQDIVIHAAAYKQVPSAEANVDEAIATNVTGSLNVARAAVFSNVERVVGISTDKACAPVNAYGATKSLMEKLFQQADDWGATTFNCVRYGNVLGSRGSVVPLFKSQLQSGQTLTVTDPNMTRFWMTLDDAVDAVIRAMGDDISRGAIFIPKCNASSMIALVHACSKLWGDEEYVHISPLIEIGTRPGEKKHEQLVHVNEGMHTLEREDCFEILPATSKYRDGKCAYSSDMAPQLTVDELAVLLDVADA